MLTILLLAFVGALAASRPWQAQDEEWFEMSALLGAVLLGACLLTITDGASF